MNVAVTIRPSRSSVKTSCGPPIPREHGAWVMLYAPLVIGLAVARPFAWAPAALLVLAVTGVYLGQNAAAGLIRRRGGRSTSAWLIIYAGAAALGGAPLLFAYNRIGLLAVGAAAGVLFATRSVLLVLPGRKRMDRSASGEILGAAALSLTAPAAQVSASGSLTAAGWLLWLACFLYFSGGVLFVRMLLSVAKLKTDLTPPLRWRLGRVCLSYHLLLALGLVVLVAANPSPAAVCLAAAYTPAVLRAAASATRLSRRPPPLKRVGMIETAYAAWFMALLIAAVSARR